MSGFFSSKYLRYRQAETLETIADDLHCPGCGYNLRGLNYGGSCPECSTAIERGSAGFHDVILAGDRVERTTWRIGLAITFGCVVAAVAARLILFVGGIRGVSTMMINFYLVTGLLLSVLWAGASWMVTPRRVAEHWPWMRLPRLFVRFSQVLWPVGYVCWLLAAVTSADVMDTLGRLSRCMAGAGTIVLAFMLCRVAEEAERENAARRLNAAVWLLPVATLVPQLFPSSIAWFTLVPLGMFLLLWAWVMLLLASGLLELQRHVTWAKVHAEEGHTRRQRIIETHQQIEREVEASIRPLQPPLPEVPLDPQGDPAGR